MNNELSDEFDLSNTCLPAAPSSRPTRRRPARRGACLQGIGRFRGGLTSRIVAAVDALGCLARFVILPGQAHDLAGVSALLKDFPFGALIGDNAFVAGWLIGDIKASGAEAVIPPRRNRSKLRDHYREMYGVAAPDRECLRKNQGVPVDRHPRGQDRCQFRRGDSPRQWRGGGNMIVNRP